MNICFIGDYSNNLDEGLKNIAYYTAREMSKKHNVSTINVKKLLNINALKTIITYNPDTIHYFTGPTFSSFVLLKILSLRWPKSLKLICALHPKSFLILSKNWIFLKTASFLRPDAIIVQEPSSKSFFESIGYETKIISNGVDLNKFVPVNADTKKQLREKYGIDQNKFVLLHVGHLSKVRNLQIFERLQQKDQQVIIVGSTYLGEDEELSNSLKSKGCIIFKGYFKDVHELYALADCYIFPVEKGNSIFMPLSVLEAMSCNLPVISTKFEGLLSAFSDGEGLFFEDSDEIYPRIISELKLQRLQVNTREKVSSYSWENISNELTTYYLSLRGDIK
jgi:glycosyltransferase involved in cell wall biosynthesis